MNKTYYLLFFLFLFSKGIILSQETDWQAYELDEVIEFEMPGENVFQLDTISQSVKVNQIYTQIGSTTYSIQKVDARGSDPDKYPFTLPYNKKSLMEYYDGIIEGMNNVLKSKSVKNKQIIKDIYFGQNVIFSNESDMPFYESNIFLLGNDMYTISYYDNDAFNPELKEYFLNSLQINNTIPISQFNGKAPDSFAEKMGYQFGNLLAKLTMFAIIAAIILGIVFVVRRFKKK
jgi:hypothetical protein